VTDKKTAGPGLMMLTRAMPENNNQIESAMDTPQSFEVGDLHTL